MIPAIKQVASSLISDSLVSVKLKDLTRALDKESLILQLECLKAEGFVLFDLSTDGFNTLSVHCTYEQVMKYIEEGGAGKWKTYFNAIHPVTIYTDTSSTINLVTGKITPQFGKSIELGSSTN